MTFPVEFHFFSRTVPAHLLFESMGYTLASLLYIRLGKKFPGPHLYDERGLWIILGCLMGALVGSKSLAIVESIHQYWPMRGDPRVFLGGKTIVGGLAGGWIGVELAKKAVGIRQRGGDRFVFPIILGLCIGRIGCFLTGLDDHTYGVATNLPWGVDFGDGIRRHPTQLYEIAFCMVQAVALLIRLRRPIRGGEIFRMFMAGYFTWRFFVEFIKPRETYFGLSPIQMTSLVVVCVSLVSLRRLLHEPPGSATAASDVPVAQTPA
jgi:phosphatidylglycerol:prolipoprotein diacylglycerol transferase